ncbi:baseplate J/gp47 family protein [Paenibacillus sp. FSL W8-0919]|uniref:baseplate J/gp47 family protein n=1 Tax=Paenibacillus sp. FSL W8-0919 TaxID=2954707 RepID=UPI004046A7DC
MGKCRVYGETGHECPEGNVCGDETTGESSVEYVTTASVTLGQEGTGTAPIRAVTPGKSGNVPAGVIQLMMTSVSGVTSVTNPEPTRSGTDVETDQSLLPRGHYLGRAGTDAFKQICRRCLNWPVTHRI